MSVEFACKGKSRLVILARRFPFNHGEVAAESYLETEILYLARHFDEMLAVGTEASYNDAPTCPLPDNVVPLALGCANELSDKIKLSLQGLMLPFGSSGRLKETLESDPVDGLRRKLFRGYFATRANRKFDKICKCLDDLGFFPTHIYSFWLYDTALVASWLSQKYPRVRIVARAHGYDLYEDRNHARYLPFRPYLLDNLGAVLTCSKDGESYLKSKWPEYGSRIRTLYLGTAPLPDKSNEPKGEVLELASCSRVVEIKRVGLIAEAVKVLDQRGIKVSWTHYGDGPLAGELESISRNFTTCEAKFPGNVPNNALLQEYASRHYDLFINVSSSEGLPISIMEACGVGIPILATDVGGTSEIVSNGINGFLLSRDCSAKDIADAIVRFSELDSTSAQKMRVASRRAWKAGFQTEENVLELVHILGIDTEAGRV